MSDWNDARKEKPIDGVMVLVETKQHLNYKVCRYKDGKWFYRNPFNPEQLVKMSWDVIKWRYLE